MHLEGHYIGFPEFLRSFLSFSGGWGKRVAFRKTCSERVNL